MSDLTPLSPYKLTKTVVVKFVSMEIAVFESSLRDKGQNDDDDQKDDEEFIDPNAGKHDILGLNEVAQNISDDSKKRLSILHAQLMTASTSLRNNDTQFAQLVDPTGKAISQQSIAFGNIENCSDGMTEWKPLTNKIARIDWKKRYMKMALTADVMEKSTYDEFMLVIEEYTKALKNSAGWTEIFVSHTEGLFTMLKGEYGVYVKETQWIYHTTSTKANNRDDAEKPTLVVEEMITPRPVEMKRSVNSVAASGFALLQSGLIKKWRKTLSHMTKVDYIVQNLLTIMDLRDESSIAEMGEPLAEALNNFDAEAERFFSLFEN
ncbi:hypothetical protein CkaCkLH20_01997 [Colletotrichum karsti]|uniref:Uncharacterized protein n=1 Tax=Colletotrichum karsti TaxID=1095194 RepID=A0A9P6IE21_9PEZI|nr:uncharacterized protein CkaCkLH20_01997 [Colletotrichum karsti]KAF9880955.1 hypothetical protein CkaCkLH20_01997 [Colletotrichum karsti]